MGAWNTLHLFDSDGFYENGVTNLQGKGNDLAKDYMEFLASFRVGGISNLSSSELEDIVSKSVLSVKTLSNQFDTEFKKHSEYDSIESWDDKRDYLNSHEQSYEFGKFFETYIFKYYADFYPHINCGKYGLYGKLGSKPNSVVDEIIGNLEDSDNYFCPHGAGIVNWISKEDTLILSECKNDFSPEEEYRSIFNAFFDLVKIACDNELGLIRGVDMIEDILHALPDFKLVSESKWRDYNFEGIFDMHSAAN